MTNDRGEQLTLYVGYTGAAPAAETTEIIQALDRAVAEFYSGIGVQRAFVEIVDAKGGSIKLWLSIAAVGLSTAQLAADHPGALSRFIDLLKIGVMVFGDATVPSFARSFLGLCARPVAEGRASEVSLGSTEDDGVGFSIVPQNAQIIVNNYFYGTDTRAVPARPSRPSDAPDTESVTGSRDNDEAVHADAIEDEAWERFWRTPATIYGIIQLGAGPPRERALTSSMPLISAVEFIRTGSVEDFKTLVIKLDDGSREFDDREIAELLSRPDKPTNVSINGSFPRTLLPAKPVDYRVFDAKLFKRNGHWYALVEGIDVEMPVASAVALGGDDRVYDATGFVANPGTAGANFVIATHQPYD